MSIPKDLTVAHVIAAIGDLDRGIDHGFGDARGYLLEFEGRVYPPKAVVGIAARHLTGRVLDHRDFSSGVAPGQAVAVLRDLGFRVVEIHEQQEDLKTRSDWSEAEVHETVLDYFRMLEAECLAQPYSKAEHRRQLQDRLSNRSEGSIEFKHQNISAVLVESGLPYINGYKPRGNYQKLLVTAIEDFIESRPGFLERLAESPLIDPTSEPDTSTAKLASIFTEPPDYMRIPNAVDMPWLSRKARKIDFVERDARNRRLGLLGEEFAFKVEKARLIQAGRVDLASKVEWLSRDIGDGLGFDILSYSEVDESEKYLEVKTTGQGKYTPFLVTANEVRCSEDMTNRFELFRVFDFGTRPSIYVLNGSLQSTCNLNPVLFRANL